MDSDYKKLLLIAFLLALAIVLSLFIFVLGDRSQRYTTGGASWDRALDKAFSRGDYSNQYVRDIPDPIDGVRVYGNRDERTVGTSTGILDGYDLFGLDIVGSRFTPNTSDTIQKEEPGIVIDGVGYVEVTYEGEVITDGQRSRLSFGKDCLVNDRLIPDGIAINMYLSSNREGDISCQDQAKERACVDGVFSSGNEHSYFYCNDKPKGGCDLDGEYMYPDTTAVRYSRVAVHPQDSCDNYMIERYCKEGTLSGHHSFKYGSCEIGEIGDTCVFDDWVVRHGEGITAYLEQEGSEVYCKERSQVRTCIDGYLDGKDEYQYRVCEVRGS